MRPSCCRHDELTGTEQSLKITTGGRDTMWYPNDGVRADDVRTGCRGGDVRHTLDFADYDRFERLPRFCSCRQHRIIVEDRSARRSKPLGRSFRGT